MFYRICRRILPLTLALLLIISCVPVAYTADFSDVPRTHWAYSYIHDAVDRKLIQGYGDWRFHPEEPVSVQAFLSMVCRTGWMTASSRAVPTGRTPPLPTVPISAGSSRRSWASAPPPFPGNLLRSC